MAAPSFVQAGAGVTITTGVATVGITGATAGNFLMLHFMNDGTTGDWSLDPGAIRVTNIEDLDGTPTAMEAVGTGYGLGSPGEGNHSLFVGRVTANGAVSQRVDVGASGEDLICRMYEFSGVSTATTQAGVMENGAGIILNGAGTSTDMRDQDVQTMGNDRLALNFYAMNGSQAPGNAFNETGGDWTEAVAEYVGTGTVGTLQLQSAVMASAGTIGGGETTITSGGWGSLGLALIPAAAGPSLRSQYLDFDYSRS